MNSVYGIRNILEKQKVKALLPYQVQVITNRRLRECLTSSDPTRRRPPYPSGAAVRNPRRPEGK